MEFPKLNTRLDIGTLLIHRYSVPTPDGPKRIEDKIMISRISYSYGIEYSGDKKPKFYVTYHFKRFNQRSGKFTDTLGVNSFQEDQLDVKYNGIRKFEVINN